MDLDDVPAEGISGRLTGAGVWRYAAWIPVLDALDLSMGEGGTALIPGGRDLPGVWAKLEFVSPTGSFKDRGAVVLVASAVARGAPALIADSSGNAGAAIAAYATRAGLPCTVFVPSGTSAGKQAQIRAYGGLVELVDGDRTAAGVAAMARVASTGAVYASHVYDPMFLQGTKTFAYECWEQLGRAPDVVVLPVGNGTLVLGAARGFRELRAGGVISRLPRLIAVQAQRCAPLAQAWRAGAATRVAVAEAEAQTEADAGLPTVAEAGLPTVAEGIAVPTPPRGAQVLAAVRESGGAVLSVPEEAIGFAQRDLARRGLLVEPTAAVAWAATLRLRSGGAAGTWDRSWDSVGLLDGDVLVAPLCGSGLKSG